MVPSSGHLLTERVAVGGGIILSGRFNVAGLETRAGTPELVAGDARFVRDWAHHGRCGGQEVEQRYRNGANRQRYWEPNRGTCLSPDSFRAGRVEVSAR